MNKIMNYRTGKKSRIMKNQDNIVTVTSFGESKTAARFWF